MRIYKYQVENELRNLNTIDKYYFKDYVHRITSKLNKLIRLKDDKKYRYYCTHCQKWHEDKKVNIKTFKKCPHCDRKFEVITQRNVIQKIQDYITVVEKNERNELIIRLFYFYKTYDKQKMKFRFDCFEVERINYDQDVYMKMNTYNNMGNICHSNCSYEIRRDIPGCYGKKLGDYYFYGYVITTNIKKLVRNTRYKYSCLDIIARNKIDILEYLKVYERHNELELLVKNKNFKLVEDIIRNGYTPIELENKKNLKYLKYDFTLKEFKNAVYFNLNKYADIKAYGYINAMQWINELNKLDQNINKLIHYLHRQKQTIDYYKDYIETAKEIGMNIGDTRVLYPKKLAKAHDDVMEQYEITKNERISKAIMEYAKELEKLSFKEKKLIIMPAHSQDELIEESKVLEHCVRQYSGRMANRETAIFFIRNTREKNKPYATLELKKNKVVQCRCFKNNKPNENVINFVNDWCKKYKLQSCFS